MCEKINILAVVSSFKDSSFYINAYNNLSDKERTAIIDKFCNYNNFDGSDCRYKLFTEYICKLALIINNNTLEEYKSLLTLLIINSVNFYDWCEINGFEKVSINTLHLAWFNEFDLGKLTISLHNINQSKIEEILSIYKKYCPKKMLSLYPYQSEKLPIVNRVDTKELTPRIIQRITLLNNFEMLKSISCMKKIVHVNNIISMIQVIKNMPTLREYTYTTGIVNFYDHNMKEFFFRAHYINMGNYVLLTGDFKDDKIVGNLSTIRRILRNLYTYNYTAHFHMRDSNNIDSAYYPPQFSSMMDKSLSILKSRTNASKAVLFGPFDDNTADEECLHLTDKFMLNHCAIVRLNNVNSVTIMKQIIMKNYYATLFTANKNDSFVSLLFEYYNKCMLNIEQHGETEELNKKYMKDINSWLRENRVKRVMLISSSEASEASDGSEIANQELADQELAEKCHNSGVSDQSHDSEQNHVSDQSHTSESNYIDCTELDYSTDDSSIPQEEVIEKPNIIEILGLKNIRQYSEEYPEIFVSNDYHKEPTHKHKEKFKFIFMIVPGSVYLATTSFNHAVGVGGTAGCIECKNDAFSKICETYVSPILYYMRNHTEDVSSYTPERIFQLQDKFIEIFKQFGIIHYFTSIVDIHTIYMRKPRKDIFEKGNFHRLMKDKTSILPRARQHSLYSLNNTKLALGLITREESFVGESIKANYNI